MWSGIETQESKGGRLWFARQTSRRPQKGCSVMASQEHPRHAEPDTFTV